jgi:hypothetical protein
MGREVLARSPIELSVSDRSCNYPETAAAACDHRGQHSQKGLQAEDY